MQNCGLLNVFDRIVVMIFKCLFHDFQASKIRFKTIAIELVIGIIVNKAFSIQLLNFLIENYAKLWPLKKFLTGS